MDFKSYLMRYADKDNACGDFARDALDDPDFPFDADYQHLLHYLYFHWACPEAVTAFKQIAENYRRRNSMKEARP